MTFYFTCLKTYFLFFGKKYTLITVRSCSHLTFLMLNQRINEFLKFYAKSIVHGHNHILMSFSDFVLSFINYLVQFDKSETIFENSSMQCVRIQCLLIKMIMYTCNICYRPASCPGTIQMTYVVSIYLLVVFAEST